MVYKKLINYNNTRENYETQSSTVAKSACARCGSNATCRAQECPCGQATRCENTPFYCTGGQGDYAGNRIGPWNCGNVPTFGSPTTGLGAGKFKTYEECKSWCVPTNQPS